MEKLLLRPTEAADLLGIGRTKVYALLAAGDLPQVRVGHSVRVPAAALARWIEERMGWGRGNSPVPPVADALRS